MLLKLRNVAMIDEANINLEGITVIAGENNTGKSTISKMLFCIINSFYNIEKQIYSERISSISRILDSYYRRFASRPIRRFPYREFCTKLVEGTNKYLGDNSILIKEINTFFEERVPDYNNKNSDDLKNIVDQVLNRLIISDYDVKRTVVKRYLQSEFDMQINHINNTQRSTEVILEDRGSDISIFIDHNEEITIGQNMGINAEVIYIDDPYVIDGLGGNSFFGNSHKLQLINKLENDSEPTIKGVFEEVVNKQKLSRIINIINRVSDGELLNSGGDISFKEKSLLEPVSLVNISSGLKTFIIIKTLLLNGELKQNGIIILDEPEIHLHPEWQLMFAEIIVLLIIEFEMKILINTHSPYFLNAIEVYSAKYSVGNKCKYYLAESMKNHSNISDVTNCIEKIYNKLSRPLQILENEKYNNEKY